MALGHGFDRQPCFAAGEREGVDQPRMAEQVDHLATPAFAGGAVDEERVLDPAVDRPRVGRSTRSLAKSGDDSGMGRRFSVLLRPRASSSAFCDGEPPGNSLAWLDEVRTAVDLLKQISQLPIEHP